MFKKLSGELEKTVIPYDHYRIIPGESKIDTVSFFIRSEFLGDLLKLSGGSDTNIHMILTAALLALLKKYTGNSDIIAGVPIYKQDVEGQFINTVLPLRNKVENNMTFKELLLQVRKTISEAVENQSYPMERLLEGLNLPKSNNNSPLFDVAILLENIHDKKYIENIKLNFILSFSRKDEYLEGVVHYNSSLYKKKTIKRVIDHFTQFLQNALKHVNLTLSHIDILTEEERILWGQARILIILSVGVGEGALLFASLDSDSIPLVNNVPALDIQDREFPDYINIGQGMQRLFPGNKTAAASLSDSAPEYL